MAFSHLDNLDRWIRSGQPDTWVAQQAGAWNDTDWTTLLEELERGPFWPMTPGDIGQHLESRGQRYRAQRAEVLADCDTNPIKHALGWYVAGLAVVGLASGFFAGASHTPIVGTLLPLLFALIGGGSGFYVANADLSAPTTTLRLEWLGRALGLFGLACLVGSVTGIGMRLHQSERGDRNALLRIMPRYPIKDGIELAVLRAKLRMLDASPDEERLVLKAGADSIADANKPVSPEHVRELVAEISQLKDELKRLRDAAAASNTPVPEDADNLVTALNLFAHQTEPWTQSGMPRDLYKNAVDSIWYHLGRIAFPVRPATAAWVDQTGFDTKGLYKLYVEIHEEVDLRDDLDWEIGAPIGERLDRYLQWANKPSVTLPVPEPLMPSIETPAQRDTGAPQGSP